MSKSTGVNFTRGSAKQIAQTVRTVRGIATPYTGNTRRTRQLLSSPLRRFELKEDITEDNADPDNPDDVNAYLLVYNSSTEEYEIDEDTTFWLYSFTGFTGTGRDAGPPVVDGTRGWCTKKDGRWEVVGGGGGSVKFAVLDADLDQGGSATASIWDGDPLADTGDNETVYDWFLDSGESLSSSTRVVITKIAGKWYVIQAKCEL